MYISSLLGIVASLMIVSLDASPLAPSHGHHWHVQTTAVHAGCESELNGFTVVPPISLSTTFVQEFPGRKPGLDDPNSHGLGYYYSRVSNPTRGGLERALSAVENAKHCSVFSSGLAATQAVVQLLESGEFGRQSLLFTCESNFGIPLSSAQEILYWPLTICLEALLVCSVRESRKSQVCCGPCMMLFCNW